MKNELITPDFIFESSWEVCNKVGGIYTVLSSRAETLQQAMPDKIVFIGPDVWHEAPSPYFEEDHQLLADWRRAASLSGLNVRVGRWLVPGRPVAVLVDFRPYFALKNELYGWLWNHYGVDSLHAYGDYDEASMFSYAAALVVESYYTYYLGSFKHVVYHANEWMCGLGALYINHRLPAVATIFTTHATSIGRSIAGNGKPLYDYLEAYNGDQMANELNMQSKHSIEKQTAMHADCFTTVSDLTARECQVLLGKAVDVVTPNGFAGSFVPQGAALSLKRSAARAKMLAVARALTASPLPDDSLIVMTSGRYEWRNKGIDVFVDAIHRLQGDQSVTRPVVALVCVPAWVRSPRQDLSDRINMGEAAGSAPLPEPRITHWLNQQDSDPLLNAMNGYGMHNGQNDSVKLIFVPCYLDGHDGIFNMTYYDLLPGADLCVFPSYYEPWGYTPLEAIAFHVPCITTNLAGFGLWAGQDSKLESGVEVVARTDSNAAGAAAMVEQAVARYANMSAAEVATCRKKAAALAKKALWSRFIAHYYTAYDIALRKAAKRQNN